MRVIQTLLLLILIGVGIYKYVDDHILGAYWRMHCNDFKHIYLGAELLVKAGNPYDVKQLFLAAKYHGIENLNPYVYPPFTGLVLGFLTLFPFEKAAHIWFALNHLFFWLSIIIIFIGLRLPLRLGFVALALIMAGTMFPLYRTLTAGQLNCALLLLVALIWWAYSQDKDIWTGLLIGFATLFKLAPGIFFLFLLWKRRWRTFGFAVLFLLIFQFFSMSVTNPAVHMDFFPVAQAMSYGHSTWEVFGMDFYRDPFNQSFNSFFHHIFTVNPHTIPWVELAPKFADIFTYIVSLALLMIGLFQTFPVKRESTKVGEDLEFSLFTFLMLLLPSLFWDHYLVVLIFPIFVLSRFLTLKRYVEWILFVAAIIIICIPIPFGARLFSRGAGILFMSLKLWATMILFGLTVYYISNIRKTRITVKLDYRAWEEEHS